MKLYYARGACSLSPHIVLLEAGLPHEMERVDLKSKRTESGADFTQINPKGYVPALELDNGQVLTEGPAIVQYLADQKPDTGLAPRAGSMERYRLQEWLNFITAEIHKEFGPLFNATFPEEAKTLFRDKLRTRFEYVDKHLDAKLYLMGERFTVADAYLFTVGNWMKRVNIDGSQWPALSAYMQRVGARPKVVEAMRAEEATQ